MTGAPPDCARCPALVKSRLQIVNGRGTPGYIAFVGLGPGGFDAPDVGLAGQNHFLQASAAHGLKESLA